MDSIIEWILTLLGSGGLGAAITYIFTFKSKQTKAKAEAEQAELTTAHEKLDLTQDKYEFLQNTLDKYVRDYHELEADFRKQMVAVREHMDEIMRNHSTIIAEKCNEIASLKSQVTYLKGIRCYRFTCNQRVKCNPDKKE